MTKSIVIGHCEKKASSGESVTIFLLLDDPQNQIGIAEGTGFMSSGGSFPAEVVLKESWQENIQLCNCQWLVDEVKAIQSKNEPITGNKLKVAWDQHQKKLTQDFSTVSGTVYTASNSTPHDIPSSKSQKTNQTPIFRFSILSVVIYLIFFIIQIQSRLLCGIGIYVSLFSIAAGLAIGLPMVLLLNVKNNHLDVKGNFILTLLFKYIFWCFFNILFIVSMAFVYVVVNAIRGV